MKFRCEKWIKNFGTNLQRLRKDKGISQEQLATDSGICQSQISDIEKGKQEPGLCNIVRLANGLQMPPFELLQTDFPYPITNNSITTKNQSKWKA